MQNPDDDANDLLNIPVEDDLSDDDDEKAQSEPDPVIIDIGPEHDSVPANVNNHEPEVIVEDQRPVPEPPEPAPDVVHIDDNEPPPVIGPQPRPGNNSVFNNDAVVDLEIEIDKEVVPDIPPVVVDAALQINAATLKQLLAHKPLKIPEPEWFNKLPAKWHTDPDLSMLDAHQ